MNKINVDSNASRNTYNTSFGGTSVSGYVSPRTETPKTQEQEIPFIDHEEETKIEEDSAVSRAEKFNNLYAEVEETVDSTDNAMPISNQPETESVSNQVQEEIYSIEDRVEPFVERPVEQEHLSVQFSSLQSLSHI